MGDFESSKQKIKRLVEEFRENEHIYTSANFDEENTKTKFISKFFKILGWDVDNELGRAPQYADVEFEHTLHINGKAKAPDYCFKIGIDKKFFVEAKKPSENIETNKKHAFQLKRYTWSAQLPLGILTDFEELAIYEPKQAPKKTHNASVDRIHYYKYTEYAEKWEEIYNIFSKDAVYSGKFDNYVEDIHGERRGTSTVDDEFLKTIEEWRLDLARNIALRNKELSIEELNFAVQLIIDRIIFLRIAEDRGIEKYGQLAKLLDLAKNNITECPVYEGFIELCKKADAKYNSGLFHFKEEKEISLSADTLTPTLHIDDGKLVKIIKGLYYPDCPYEFSMISTEILGNIYEQFLGKVIRLTEGHQAKVEDKPEVKKAGGVYYTPQYIVDYIVDNTVGELLKGKTPNQVSKLRIVDPACGSGSFLLRAYQKLLDWHLDYYSNLEKPPRNVIYTGKKGIRRLTIQEKKRILLNNIYGVDIDSQAVEVTKLSLLLKVLEDQNKDILEAQQKLIQERALPYLGDNIRCGNSLIGTDILEEDLSMEEISKINPFDWEESFKEIFMDGGFDVVIGNPPWGAEFSEKELKYLKNKHNDVIDRMINSFLYFIHSSSFKLKENGFFGMIIPDVILYQKSYIPLRKFILNNFKLQHLLNLGNGIFKNVNQPSAIIIFKNDDNKKGKIICKDFTKLNNVNKEKCFNKIDFDKYSQKILYDLPNNIFITSNLENYSILNKIQNISDLKVNDILGDDKKIQRGASPDLKEAFIVNEEIIEKYDLEESKIKKMVSGGFQVKRYYINFDGQYLIYTTKKDNFRQLPNIRKYINQFKDDITCKEVLNGKHPLYALHRPRKEEIFLKDVKIMGVITSDKLILAIDNNQLFATDGVYLFSTTDDFNPYFVVSILNSKLFTFIYRLYSLENGRILPQVKPSILKELPFKSLTINEQQTFIELSNKMTKLNKDLTNCRTPNEKRLLETQINRIEKQINQLVYELYNLTEDEIKIIEDSFKE